MSLSAAYDTVKQCAKITRLPGRLPIFCYFEILGVRSLAYTRIEL